MTSPGRGCTLGALAEEHIRREAVSDQLYALLRDRILSGALAAGTALTAERELAAEFEVNRHAVREAVKRLQQARLVEVSHGGAHHGAGLAAHGRTGPGGAHRRER
ncbi:GntR family transcriptional regulator [Streptomyces sp. MN3]